ncbi:MAG: undecaprenyl-diphosphate phosphatase [Pseudomonadota bacterium]
MDIILALKAAIMGLVEGFTEFLPISSTGHLILAGSLLDFRGMEEKMKVFEVVIQAGAIFAVCWEYRAKIAAVLQGLFSDKLAQRFAANVVIAFLPAAVLGYLFHQKITDYLFSAPVVAFAFIAGGIVILMVERHVRLHPASVRIHSTDTMGPLDALKIGCAQVFALIPGTSRSGATIMGAMLFGTSRTVATEFSFFLAIPTLLGATVLKLYKSRALLSSADIPLFTVGTVFAFLSAFICVRWLLRYISSHDFSAFAWYRIGFGILILLTSHFHWVVWAD